MSSVKNAWPGQRSRHKTAGRLGWAFRSGRRKGPRSPAAYLRAAGITPSALARYVKGRKTPAKRLWAKRGRGHRKGYRVMGARVNRRPGRYAKFVKAFAHRSHLRGPSLMRAAARAWHGGARRNQAIALPGQVFYDDNRGRRGRGRHRARRDRRGRFVRGNGRRVTHRSKSGKRVHYTRWWNNPVLPQMAWDNRKRGKRGRARRNPVLPYAAFNRRSADNPIEAVGEAFETAITPDFWTDTVLPMGAGFIGGQFVGGLVQGLVEKLGGAAVQGTGIVPSLARVGSRLIGSAAVSAAAFMVTKDSDIAGKVLAGGLVAVLAQVLVELFGKDTYSKITGMSGFGAAADSLTSELKRRIADSIRHEMSSQGTAGHVSAFVTTQDIATGPRLGPPAHGPGQYMQDFATTQAMRTAPVAGQVQQMAPMVADLSSFSDSMMDLMLV